MKYKDDSKKINPSPCSICDGDGLVPAGTYYCTATEPETCRNCKGTGIDNRKKTLDKSWEDNKSTLFWKPVIKCGENFLDNDLKLKISKRYFKNNDVSSAVLTEEDIPYFMGLKDAGIKDANAIIENIREYRRIEIYIEYKETT